MPGGDIFSGRGNNLIGLRGDLRRWSIGFYSLQRLHTSFAIALLAQEPARAFRKCQASESIKQGWKRCDAEHPAPGIFPDSRKESVRNESNQNAENNVELKHAAEPAAVLRRCDLGDVHGRNHGRNANSQPANEARDNESTNIRGQCRTGCTDDIKQADPQEGKFSAEPISRPSSKQRTKNCSIERGCNRKAVQAGAQAPERLNRLFSPGNDDGIEAK